MLRLPNGIFITIIGLEGEFEIRCRNGERRNWGYVTPMFSEKIVVKAEGNCVQITGR